MKTTEKWQYKVTTNPANFGYGGRPTEWKTSGGPDAIGTINTVLKNAKAMKRRIGVGEGSGTYFAEIYIAPNGEHHAEHELNEMLWQQR